MSRFPFWDIGFVDPDHAKPPSPQSPHPHVPLTDDEWAEIRRDVALAAPHSRAWARMLVAVDRADARRKEISSMLDAANAYSLADVPLAAPSPQPETQP